MTAPTKVICRCETGRKDPKGYHWVLPYVQGQHLKRDREKREQTQSILDQLKAKFVRKETAGASSNVEQSSSTATESTRQRDLAANDSPPLLLDNFGGGDYSSESEDVGNEHAEEEESESLEFLMRGEESEEGDSNEEEVSESSVLDSVSSGKAHEAGAGSTDMAVDHEPPEENDERHRPPIPLEWKPSLRRYLPSLPHPLAPVDLDLDHDEDDDPLQINNTNPLPPIARLVADLVVSLHYSFGLSRSACDWVLSSSRLLLRLIRKIFIRAVPQNSRPVIDFARHLEENHDQLPSTCRTLLRRLGLGIRILHYPICPHTKCRHVFPHDTASNPLPSKCPNLRAGKRAGSTVVCNTFLTKRTTYLSPPQPILTMPVVSIRDVLLHFLRRPGFEHLLWEDPEKRTRSTPAFELKDVYDGRAWKEHLGRNDSCEGATPRFFGQVGRLGFTVYEDGIRINHGTTSRSKSVGLLWLTINNLPRELRFRSENMALIAILVGPTEYPTSAFHQVQQIIVEQLKQFWEGVTLPSTVAQSPRTWHGTILQIIGDRLAINKMIGQTPHSSTSFCSLDDATLAQKNKDPVVRDRYKRTMTWRLDQLNYRDGSTRYQEILDWKNASPTSRKKLEVLNGATPSPWIELPYTDLPSLAVLDFVHSAYLGVAKWQQLQLLIRTGFITDSLDSGPFLRYYLSRFVTPKDIGRLPDEWGPASAGSPKADQLRTWVELLAAPVLWMVMVEGTVWEEIELLENLEAQRFQGKSKARGQGKEKGKGKQQDLGNEFEIETPMELREEDFAQDSSSRTKPRTDFEQGWKEKLKSMPSHQKRQLFREVFDNFLKLVVGCRLASHRSTTEAQGRKSSLYFAQYAAGLCSIYSDNALSPNHHYLLHVDFFISLYGSVYGYWTFAHERMNGIVGAYDTNAKPGQAETTMMSKFWTDSDLKALRLYSRAEDRSDEEEQMFEELTKIKSDFRGTVSTEIATSSFSRATSTFLTKLNPHLLSSTHRDILAQYLNSAFASHSSPLFIVNESASNPNQLRIPTYVSSSTSAVIDGTYFAAHSLSKTKVDDSTVLAEWVSPDQTERKWRIGQIERFIHLSMENNVGLRVDSEVAWVRWRVSAEGTEQERDLDSDLVDSPFNFEELGIRLVKPQVFEVEDQTCIVPISRIRCKTAHLQIRVSGTSVIACVSIDRKSAYP